MSPTVFHLARRLSLSFVVVFAAAGPVFALPWGLDVTGFLPPDPPKGPVTKCENTVNKAVVKLMAGIAKCHAGRAAGKYDEAAEEACETAVQGKFLATKTLGCDACTDLGLTANAFQGNSDLTNQFIYCAGATPFGGDDTGFLPPDAPAGPTAKCEKKVNTAVAKLLGGIFKCRAGRAVGKYPDRGAESTCEGAAMAKFFATDTAGCDPCTDVVLAGNAAASLATGLNGVVYCKEGETCGNGVREGSEACDGSDLGVCQDGCEADCTCTPPTCTYVGGSCWISAGLLATSCTTACASIGKTCSAATISYAGSGGTDANCQAVLTALGVNGSSFVSADCTPIGQGLGCSYDPIGGMTARCATPPTTCEATYGNFVRVCACE